MLVEVKVPPLAESIADATLMSWYKKVGDFVKKGENLVDLETDKVTLEVAAPQDGTLKEIRKADGETAVADEVLAIIDTDGTAKRAAPSRAAAEESTKTATSGATGVAPRMSPSVRKLMDERGIDPAAISGTGKDGRITKSDVLAHGQSPEARETRPAAPATPLSEGLGARAEERVPMTRLRKRAAERLLAAQHGSAILTTFNEVGMQAVMDLRARHKDAFEAEHGVKLGFMSFFVKASVEALKRFPVLNASVDGEDIVYHGYFDIGIAVSAPRGLVVPILRDADALSFAAIESAIRDFGQKAREGKLGVEELTGGTFTITNGGIFGSLLSTPIINPPQSAILGMHKIEQRPVVEAGQIVVRPMMYLALSYDHRIIDGREAVQFLVTVKEQLEDPGLMLLQL
jgi:2-oxoglutarate dehydrogenase E2 component (dihydrolipoamide succinyltransferase)